jgi:hypothetical protein
VTISEFAARMNAINDAIARRDYTVASRSCQMLAGDVRSVDSLAAFHLRVTSAFLDLMEHGTPNPQALMEIEDLLADAGRDIGYDDRIEIDLAALAQFCRLYRFCLFDDTVAVEAMVREHKDDWLGAGGSIPVMSYVLSCLCLLNRELRQPGPKMEIPLIGQMSTELADLMNRRNLHRNVGEVLVKCREFIRDLAEGHLSNDIPAWHAHGPLIGLIPSKNLWMLCAETLLRSSATLARRVIMSSKYSINAQVVTLIETNTAPINIDARRVDVDASTQTPGSNVATGVETPDADLFTFAPGYDRVILRGERFRFGPMQAAMIRMLHAASQTDNPWVPVDRLLAESGSRCRHMRDAFKNHDRDSLFEFDTLGRVRLRL